MLVISPPTMRTAAASSVADFHDVVVVLTRVTREIGQIHGIRTTTTAMSIMARVRAVVKV
jgi:hypothetical protein